MRMDDRIRVSDADREQVTARLREHFADGRLTSEELDERITAALNAKTYGDLRRVMADLPDPALATPQPGPVPPPWTGRAPYAYRRRPRFLPLLLVALIFAVVLPGAGFVAFTLLKVLLVIGLAIFLTGVVAAALAAARFRRHVRRYWRSGDWNQWHYHDWRNW